MQMALTVVGCEAVLAPSHGEPSLVNPIGIAANQRAEIGAVVLEIPIQRIIAQRHLLKLAAAVWDLERNDNATVSYDASFNTIGVGQRVEIHGLFFSRG